MYNCVRGGAALADLCPLVYFLFGLEDSVARTEAELFW